MRTDNTILLKDGRRLGFAEYGDPSGTPILHFHGSGGSRLEHPPEEGTLEGIRYISIDRPGHGLSDHAPHYQMLDWPDDVIQLADDLNIERFYALGWSAGGPRVLACAFKYPERMIAGALVAGFAPPNRPNALAGLPLPNRLLIWTGQRLPWLAALQFRLMARLINGDAERASRTILSSAPAGDKAVLEKPENLAMLLPDIREGYKNGWRGPFQDGYLQVTPWGFSLHNIQVRIDIWQGEADVNVPVHSGEYLRDTLPNASAMF
ncbi:MAG: alpha/beta hydrolase, partial [Candidatus Methanoperedens sp.]|nr:alpha/beta hydrolase [Candidatus Methanoperedens sp.]